MTKTVIAFAPTGQTLQGTDEVVPGTCRVDTYELADDGTLEPNYEGGTDFHYDGSKTLEVAGAACYLDEDGSSWLEHHLILVDADSDHAHAAPFVYSEATIDLMANEELIGRALDAANAAVAAADMVRALVHTPPAPLEFHAKVLRAAYDEAKAETLAAMKAERP